MTPNPIRRAVSLFLASRTNRPTTSDGSTTAKEKKGSGRFTKRIGFFLTLTVLAAMSFALYVVLAADQFFAGDGSAFSAAKWGSNAAGPFTSTFTANNVANFATVNGTGTGASIAVGGINATENFTLTAAGGTITNQANGVIPISVSSSKTLDFGSQAFTASATAGYIKNGGGALAFAGAAYGGGFTLNTGSVIVRGVNAMGAGNTLTISGGAIGANAARDLTGKYPNGITVAGDFQLGVLASAVPLASDTANLTFSNNVGLGAATRTITIGANGTYTLGGIISGSAGSGLTVANASGATGTLTLTGVNTYSGDTTINAGKLALSGSGSIASSPNITVAGAATFDVSATTAGISLSSSQTLRGSGNGSTGTISTAATKNLTLSGTAGLQFTAYNGSIPPLATSGAGNLVLANTNVVNVAVSNGGTPLGVGTYTLISGGGVSGTAPTTLTFTGGDGIAAGTIAFLQISGGQLVLNVVVNATGKYRSRQTGNWNDFNTWQTDTGGGFVNAVSGQTPASAADTIEIQSPHVVTITANVDADQMSMVSGSTLTVNNGVTFTVADGTGTDLTSAGTVQTAGQITNNGQVIIHGTLQIDQGGFPGGGTGTYSYNQLVGVLVFNNTSGSYAVNNDNYWPTTNGPQNVTVQGAGGITMNVARTVGLLFQYAAPVSNMGNLTLNGTSQVNTGGSTSGSPTYGPASLLKYNVNASYGRNGEWLPNATSGAGYPVNVQLSNNTNLDLPNGSSNVFFQLAGNLTIDAGSTMNLNGSPAMTQPLNVLGNVNINGTLTLSTALGGDITVGGNWTRNSAAIFTPNGRAVTFNGSGTQTVALSAAGIETFAYLLVDKPSGNLTLSSAPATSVIITSPGGGSALQINNAGGIDLGSSNNGLTLNGAVAGTNILVGGAAAPATRTITGTGSVAITGGDKSVTSNNGKTLTFETGVNVTLLKGMDFGALLTTINGTLTIGSGGFVNTNAPTYGSASTLLYDCTCVFARGAEWTGATSGPGAPNNVTVNLGTDVNLGGASPGTALQALGTLDAKSGGRFLMEFPGSEMTQPLSVFGNVLVESGGSLLLSTVSGGDLKVRSDFTNNGTFMANNRAVFFEGTAVQNVTDASGTATMPYVRVNKGGGTVFLQSNLTALAPAGGDSIQFLGATNVVTLNAKTLTLGSTIGAQPAGSGLFGDAAASLSLQDGGTGPGNAMGTIAFVAGGQSLNTLTLNRTGATGSATLGSPLSIDGGSGALALSAGVLNTGTDTLTMGGNATSTGAHNGAGASYVNGTMKKIYATVPTNFTFDLGSTGGTTAGWTPAAVDALVTSATGDVTASVTNAFAPFTDTSKALRRYWSLQNNGLTLVNLTFNYLDGDVPGTADETIFIPYKIDGAVSTNPVGTVNAALNTINVPGATSFSDWTAAEPNQPTAVKLTKFNGVSYADGVQLNWESGFEVNNLGYHLYREQQGKRARVTPAVVAGSALTVGPGSKLTAGYSYSWFDQKGTADTAYYLEAIDLNGTRQLTGPIYPYGGGTKNSPRRQRARLLSELRGSSTASNADATSEWPAAMKADGGRETLNLASGASGGLAEQQSIASGQAVKIQVNRSGWYRLSQPELVAAGLDPTSDARLLQLYVDGVEVPIGLSNNGPQLGSNDTLEFYGVGLDTPTTDTRTYWLIKGDSAGKRIIVRHGKPKEGYMSWGEASANATASFRYTVERREKLVYLSHLLNGDADNIFGAPILSEPVGQTLAINNLDSQSSLPAQLEVRLQGLTAQEHQVRVQLNGSDVGTVTFSGVEHPVATFNVNRALLHLGDNEVLLVSQNGDLDISFIDSIRLTYAHQYRADNNALGFSLAGGQGVRVGGFTSSNIRVIDVTDPNSPQEVATNAGSSQGGYAVVVPALGSEPRNLIAFTDDLSRHPAAVVANNPSNWSASTNGADLVIITHKDFRQAIEPLATLRRSQGLSVAVVDVEDVYDEFSYGAHTPVALRSFLSQAALNWSRKPGYLLLVGDSSWDPRNYFDQGANDFVPTKLIDTGYMETASDDWFADFNGAGLASMAIGRLPAQTPAEVSLMVGKILSYEQERELNVPLRGAVMVSDNGFEGQSTQTQSLLPPGIDVQTISRTQIGNDDLMRSQILSALNQGPMIVNYYGHGSVGVWTGEALLDGDSAAGLTNTNRLSLYVLMTCLNGYSHDAYVDSLGESALKAQNGGAVAVWASSGFTDSQPQFGMDLEFYRQLFGAQPVRLGEAIRKAKVAISNQDVRRTWVLLGDPTMRMR